MASIVQLDYLLDIVQVIPVHSEVYVVNMVDEIVDLAYS